MAETPVNRRLVAILIADVAGYSRLMGAEEEETLAQLKSHRRELIDPKLTEHRGRLVNTAGDGLLAEFASVVDAVRCAVEIQRAMAERNASVLLEKRIDFRIGLNLSDVILESDDIYGDGVNIAARLEALAQPGGICVSRSVRDHARDKLNLRFVDMGEHLVKNIARPVRAYRIEYEGARPAPARRYVIGRRGLIAAGMSGAALTVAFGMGAWDYLRPDVTPAGPSRPSLAVLPFANNSSNFDREWFSDGITEDIITAVSRFSGLFVIAPNSTFRYKGSNIDLTQIGHDLGARYVLTGSVRREGAQIRVTAQLTDTQTGKVSWGDKYDRKLEDIFAVQDEITRQIVGNLISEVSKSEADRSLQKAPDRMDAYDYHLQAEMMNRRAAQDRKPESLAEVRRLYQQSLLADANYAPAVAGLAENYLKAWLEPYNAPPFTEEYQRASTLDRALELAKQAVALDPDLPEAYATLGLVQHWKRDTSAAIDAFARAFSLNPNLSFPRYGDVLVYAGRARDALDVINTSMLLDPLHTPNSYAYLGHAYLMARQPDAAIEPLKACIRGSPLFRPARVWLTAAYLRAGSINEAKQSGRELLSLQPGFKISAWMSFVAYTNAKDAEYLAEALRASALPD